jgi:hypothetical protein
MGKATLVTAFILTVVGANWALDTFGFIAVAPGVMAPAGVLFAGVAFTLRDALHRLYGRKYVLAAIAIGGAISFWIEPVFAIASAIAFTVSELADLMVYERLRVRGWTFAVVGSNCAGMVVDSVLFLWLAFGSLDFIEGQLIGKAYMTAAAVAVIWGYRALPLRVHNRKPA